MRANAAGHLSQFADDARVRSALLRSLKDPDSLVRAVSALRIKPGAGDLREVVSALAHALDDPVRTVRVGATLTLVNLGTKADDNHSFECGKEEVRARFQMLSDDAASLFEAGKFNYLTHSSRAGERGVSRSCHARSTASRSLLPRLYSCAGGHDRRSAEKF